MNIVKEYHAKIDTLSVEIAESIAKIPSLPREKGLSAYQKAHRLAVANLS